MNRHLRPRRLEAVPQQERSIGPIYGVAPRDRARKDRNLLSGARTWLCARNMGEKATVPPRLRIGGGAAKIEEAAEGRLEQTKLLRDIKSG